MIKYVGDGLPCDISQPRSRYDTLRAKARKEYLLELKGNRCQSCGYEKSQYALDFHHRRKEEKSFNITSACYEFSDSAFKDLVVKEVLEKCDLLCSNCHRETHWDK